MNNDSGDKSINNFTIPTLKEIIDCFGDYLGNNIFDEETDNIILYYYDTSKEKGVPIKVQLVYTGNNDVNGEKWAWGYKFWTILDVVIEGDKGDSYPLDISGQIKFVPDDYGGTFEIMLKHSDKVESSTF
ncbi:MAG: hypothetical protein ACTSPV_16725 [Candidatus Hodarchaeales archaeon]